MSRRFLSGVLATAFVIALSFGVPASAKATKPSLGVRVSPRIAFSPVGVFATAELKGGEDSEEYYCLAIEWDWDDGSKSLQGSDCVPFTPETKIERRFTASHHYPRPGSYTVRATLSTKQKIVARDSFRVTVRQGIPQGSGNRGDY